MVEALLESLRWLFGIEEPRGERLPKRKPRGKWRTSSTGGWEWVNDPRDSEPELIYK